MERNVTKRIVDLSQSATASNLDGPITLKVAEESLHADMLFKLWAHLSIELFKDDSLIDSETLQVTFESRVDSGTIDLWSALVNDNEDCHAPVYLTKLNNSWQQVELSLIDYAAFTNAYRVLKLIVRQNCKLEIRNLQIHGVQGIESLKVVIPWFGRDAARIRARDIAISKLSEQDVAFELILLELLCDDKPATFVPTQANHQHIIIKKDSRYLGIFHKESLFEYYLKLHPVLPRSGYVFMDSDIYSTNKLWLSQIVEKLSLALRNDKPLLLQPFSQVIDTVSGNTNYSFCKAEKEDLNTMAINPGLCWAMNGTAIIINDVHFAHNLITGIADAIFATNYVKPSDLIPYLPPYSISGLTGNDTCNWDFIDENLSHVNHGDDLPHSYAMRDLLWQAILDHHTISNETPVIEDSDGFLFFQQKNSPAQTCLAHMMALEKPDSVLAQVFRNFDAPLKEIQHINIQPKVDICADPRGLDTQFRLQWECERSYFRLYALGVEKTTIPNTYYNNASIGFGGIPVLRDMVSDWANHPVLLLTAPDAVLYPTIGTAITNHLVEFDIVFFCAAPEAYNANRKASIDVATKPDFFNAEATNSAITAVAFTRAWWTENQMAIPHGLLAHTNFLDCLYRIVSHKRPEVLLLPGHCRKLVSEFSDSTLEQHNERVTNAIHKLHERMFLSIGPIHRKRRKIRLQHLPSNTIKASLVSALERLEVNQGVLFNPAVNLSFTNNNKRKPDKAYNEIWTGIVHGVFDVRKTYPVSHYSLNELLQDTKFKASLQHCAGLFTHTQYIRQQLLQNTHWDKKIPINVLPYTTEEPQRGFRADWFWRQGKPTIFSIGSTMNRLSSFFEIGNGEFNKVLVTPRVSSSFSSYLQSEMKTTKNVSSVSFQEYPKQSNFDEILSHNPVFIDHYDLNTDPVLTQCIVRNTPMIIRRHPAAEEVLGKDYPLFFSDLNQVSALLNESSILEGHVYLANISKKDHYHPALLQTLEASEIYQCL